jgi:hypothetical protein
VSCQHDPKQQHNEDIRPVLLRTETILANPEAGPSRPPRTVSPSFEPDVGEEKIDAHQTKLYGSPESEGGGNVPLRHRDEGQVLLDTKRSFVAYPKGI